jgi:hypothetical protein
MPKIYAPFPLLVVLVLIHTEAILGHGSIIAAAAFIPIVFWLWCLPILKDRTTIPRRSYVLLVGAVILSLIWLADGFSYALGYHGAEYTVSTTVINLCCCVALSVLAFYVRRRPSLVHNLTFHAALFAWLAWCAFPWLGELP